MMRTFVLAISTIEMPHVLSDQASTMQIPLYLAGTAPAGNRGIDEFL
ncbi:hypothetical protein L13192_00244 [Pyrenophora tritici-repentis]|uniref:Uncharacterized protein n=1 Tax=Pyrenophora tritici-repentis TaxID=45151 RepID=A0A922NL13_9PLEO|nr:hypothetical protein Ptr86124_003049 [Pyrenophora tritici-repentis]KAI1673497.1 hypothetical protein L13192_00244 [Pyrenophora tritici-repentis]KAI1689425.1 hypothetical protein KJE20_02603 [Pyrenophora tritici-repentis]